jgi:hypothetical protein
MTNYSENEIAQLAEQVRRRRAMDEQYAREKQWVYEEKQRLRLHQLIVEVVRSYYGRVIDEIVAKLHSFFSS